ncbi:MAG: InlB B-repeat-containing protein [Clostridia bacterium]|nr:InlB B-repeat-containing protein [Clostridia bacterium]
MKNVSKKLWAIALALCLTLPLTLGSCEGDPGPQGEPGIQGEKGDKGDTGAQGEKGDQGEQGIQGEKGDQGEQGIPGEKGDKGDTGAQGEKGDQGEQGIHGEKGDKGDTGEKGEKGDQGEQGIQGETGNGIVSVKLTATDGLIDTYTVTFTDGTTTTFTVVNGADGVQGEQGEKGDVGADGKNAYELYCEQFGYEGTLEEWLEIISSEIFKEYTVVFDLNGGTGTEDFVRKVTVRSGHSVALTIPERTGYNFLGWYIGEGANEAKFDADDRVSHNITLTAKWGIKTSTVTFLDYYEDVISTETVNWGEAATAPVPPTVTGYYFLRWDKAYDNITANTTVKALYAPVTYTVSFNTDGGSEVAAQEVYVGQSPMKPANPYKSGHYFIGWYTDEACTKAYNFNKAFEGDTTVYALFKTAMPIYTVQDLKNIANNTSGRYYLANDIDLEGEAWEPIANFYGTLDGEGHKICNFSMAKESGSGRFGFFASNSGTIKNLELSDFVASITYSDVANNNSFGMIAGHNYGVIEDCEIKDAQMSCIAKYSGYNQTLTTYFGGVAGFNQGTIEGCYVALTAQGKGDSNNTSSFYGGATTFFMLAGLVSRNEGDVLDSSVQLIAETTLSATTVGSTVGQTHAYVGGVVAQNAGSITNCHTLDGSSITLSGAGNSHRGAYVGLLAADAGGPVNNCTSKGTIHEEGGFASSGLCLGGFVGIGEGSINTCYSDVEIKSVSNHAITGGFAAVNKSTIVNCYSTGSIETQGNGGAGGFVGKHETGGSISKCFSTTNITASTRTNVNYFAGVTEDGSTTFKCFYGANVTVTAYGTAYTPTENAATSKTETELYSEDFLCDTLSWKKDVWNITGTGLPTLVWEGE